MLSDPAAQAEWGRITSLLTQLNMITELDLAIVAGYCHSFAIWKQANDEVAVKGLFINGNMNPAFRVVNDAKAQMLKFAQELGLSPVQRTRIRMGAPGKKKDNPFRKYIKEV